MRDFWTIYNQSFWTKAKTKSFVITTLVVITGIFLMANISSIISKVEDAGVFGDGADESKVYVVDDAGSLTEVLQQQLDAVESGLILESSDDSIDGPRTQISEGKIKSFLVLSVNDAQTIQATYTSENANEVENSMVIREALQNLQTNLKATS